jgi:hypothetical protein
LNSNTALGSIVEVVSPKSYIVGNLESGNFGERISKGFSKMTLIADSFSTFFLKLLKTSGMSFI